MIRLVSLTVADEPDTWASLGFDVDRIAVRIGGVTILCAGVDAGRGIVEWTLGTSDDDLDQHTASDEADGGSVASSAFGIVPPSVDGVTTNVIEGIGTPPIAGPHPNGVTSIDHVVLATPDIERTIAALEDLGLPCRGRREGRAYGENRMLQAFFWLGDPDGAPEQKVIVELVGPAVVDPEKAADPSVFFGLALTTSSLETAASAIGEHLKPPVDAVQPGRRIATISSKAGSTVPIALMTPHVRAAEN